MSRLLFDAAWKRLRSMLKLTATSNEVFSLLAKVRDENKLLDKKEQKRQLLKALANHKLLGAGLGANVVDAMSRQPSPPRTASSADIATADIDAKNIVREFDLFAKGKSRNPQGSQQRYPPPNIAGNNKKEKID